MALSTQVLSLLRLRRRARADKGTRPTDSFSAASPLRPLSETPPGVIYVPELSEDAYVSDGDGDSNDEEPAASYTPSASRPRRSDGAARSPKHRGSRFSGRVHRKPHLDKPKGRVSIIKALASRLSAGSCISESTCASREPDDRPEAEDAAGGKVEFLFFAGCPDNLNMYELEVNQYRRRTNFVSGGSTADKREPHRLQPTSDSISVGPTIVHSMPPLFAPHLRQSVSSNLLAKTDRDDYSGAHTW